MTIEDGLSTEDPKQRQTDSDLIDDVDIIMSSKKNNPYGS